MLLCIDAGNSHLYGGVFKDENIILRFRHTSKVSTSDEFGIFLKSVLRENNCNPQEISNIGICSVVPQLDYSLRAACVKYFAIEPMFITGKNNTGLNIKCPNPSEVGADRIANAIAAIHLFANKNLIIIDFGTATTFCAIDKQKNYLGGAILPGIQISVDALSSKTAKLPPVEIVKANKAVGNSTIENIQSGIFFGAIGSCRELIERIHQEVFLDEEVIIIATGGFASLFANQEIYNYQLPDLVLNGIKIVTNKNIEHHP